MTAIRPPNGQDGFSFLEVVVALLIFTVGVLAMAGSTGAIFTQLRVADRRDERAAAVQYAAEGLRAVDFDQLATACGGLTQRVGQYALSCAPGESQSNLTGLYVVSSGPGYVSGQGWKTDVVDSTLIAIAR